MLHNIDRDFIRAGHKTLLIDFLLNVINEGREATAILGDRYLVEHIFLAKV